MLDAKLQRPVVCFAHHDVYVACIAIDERLAQRRAIAGGRVENHTLSCGRRWSRKLAAAFGG